MIDLTEEEVMIPGAPPADGDESNVAAGGEVAQLEAGLEEVEGELQKVNSQIQHLLARQEQLQNRKQELQQRIAAERRAPAADWTGSFPWTQELHRRLRGTFGIQGFRPLQQEVINATLQGRDVLCLMPSGGGKSLCYQLPALLSAGVTLVISPLLSLIQDQVAGLKTMGVAGAALTSLSSKEEVAEVMRSLDAPEAAPKLLYVTPERLVRAKRLLAKLDKLYKRGLLARIAIDESHCCSQWGNDFRPDYRKLGLCKQQYPDTPLIALTATATAAVCDDLRHVLGIPAAELFRCSVNRPNLFYEVRPKSGSEKQVAQEMVAWIRCKALCGESGIVYCLTRKDCETLAAELRSCGLDAGHYHADMAPEERSTVHMLWSSGQLQVIVATVAFGMGINKADCRFVIHHSLSKSLENYYQESGRAGRDGAAAHCLLLYRFQDVLRQAAVSCLEHNWRELLLSVTRYACARGRCLRSLLLRHFGEAPADCQRMCHWCCYKQELHLQQLNMTDAAAAAARALQAHAARGKNPTMVQLLDCWKAAPCEADKALAKQVLAEGMGGALLEAMLLDGLVDLEFGYTSYSTNTYLRLGSRGALLLRSPNRTVQEVRVAVVAPTASHLRDDAPLPDEAQHPLWHALALAVDAVAASACVWPFAILTRSEMRWLCCGATHRCGSGLPQTEAALTSLLGRKLTRSTATTLLQVLRQHSSAPADGASRRTGGDREADQRSSPAASDLGPAVAGKAASEPRTASPHRKRARPV